MIGLLGFGFSWSPIIKELLNLKKQDVTYMLMIPFFDFYSCQSFSKNYIVLLYTVYNMYLRKIGKQYYWYEDKYQPEKKRGIPKYLGKATPEEVKRYFAEKRESLLVYSKQEDLRRLMEQHSSQVGPGKTHILSAIAARLMMKDDLEKEHLEKERILNEKRLKELEIEIKDRLQNLAELIKCERMKLDKEMEEIEYRFKKLKEEITFIQPREKKG
jgi:hypothetical protein